DLANRQGKIVLPAQMTVFRFIGAARRRPRSHVLLPVGRLPVLQAAGPHLIDAVRGKHLPLTHLEILIGIEIAIRRHVAAVVMYGAFIVADAYPEFLTGYRDERGRDGTPGIVITILVGILIACRVHCRNATVVVAMAFHA